MNKRDIKNINLRIQNLTYYIERETCWLACWNMCRDLAQARALLG